MITFLCYWNGVIISGKKVIGPPTVSTFIRSRTTVYKFIEKLYQVTDFEKHYRRQSVTCWCQRIHNIANKRSINIGAFVVVTPPGYSLKVHTDASLENPPSVSAHPTHVPSMYHVNKTSQTDASSHDKGEDQFFNMNDHHYDVVRRRQTTKVTMGWKTRSRFMPSCGRAK